MDIFLFSTLTIFFLGIASAIGWFFSKKAVEVNHQRLAEVIVNNIIELKAGNRYIISFPFDVTEEELTGIITTLDLENSETHVVLVEGTVTVLEFS